MVEPYKALEYSDKYFHIFNMVTSGFFGNQVVQYAVSGLLPSGEGNFYDLEQIPTGQKYFGHNGHKIEFLKGSEPFPSGSSKKPFVLFPLVVGISGLQDSVYASGETQIGYISNVPNPSGGTGEISKVPFAKPFTPSGITINPKGRPLPYVTTTTTTTTSTTTNPPVG